MINALLVVAVVVAVCLIEAAGKLIFYLLEAKLPVRRAVGEALATWPAGKARQKVVTYVRPMIEPDQRALVTPDGPPLTS